MGGDLLSTGKPIFSTNKVSKLGKEYLGGRHGQTDSAIYYIVRKNIGGSAMESNPPALLVTRHNGCEVARFVFGKLSTPRVRKPAKPRYRLAQVSRITEAYVLRLESGERSNPGRDVVLRLGLALLKGSDSLDIWAVHRRCYWRLGMPNSGDVKGLNRHPPNGCVPGLPGRTEEPERRGVGLPFLQQ